MGIIRVFLVIFRGKSGEIFLGCSVLDIGRGRNFCLQNVPDRIGIFLYWS